MVDDAGNEGVKVKVADLTAEFTAAAPPTEWRTSSALFEPRTGHELDGLLADLDTWHDWAESELGLGNFAPHGRLERVSITQQKRDEVQALQEARLAARTPLERGFDTLPPTIKRMILMMAYKGIQRGLKAANEEFRSDS